MTPRLVRGVRRGYTGSAGGRWRRSLTSAAPWSVAAPAHPPSSRNSVTISARPRTVDLHDQHPVREVLPGRRLAGRAVVVQGREREVMRDAVMPSRQGNIRH